MVRVIIRALWSCSGHSFPDPVSAVCRDLGQPEFSATGQVSYNPAEGQRDLVGQKIARGSLPWMD